MSTPSTDDPGVNEVIASVTLAAGAGLLWTGMAFGDLPWQEQLGTLTRSPMLFLAPPLAALASLRSRGRIGSLSLAFGGYWAVTTAWAVVMLLAHLIGHGELAPGGRNLAAKVFLAGAENLVFFFTVIALADLFGRASLEKVWSFALYGFLALCAVAAIESVSPETLHFLHSGVSAATVETRLSLLSAEPSQASPVFAGFFFLSLTLGVVLRKSTWTLVLLVALFAAVFLRINSKGGIPILAVSGLLPLAGLLRRNRQLGTLIGTGALLISGVLVYGMVSSEGAGLQANLEDFTSVGTRLVAAAASFGALVQYPLGMGYGTYLVHYPVALERTAAWLQDLLPVYVNLEEIALMTATGDNLSAKAGVLTQVVYNGFLALAFYGWVFWRAWKQTRVLEPRPGLAFLARTALLFMLLTIALAADSNTLYVYLLPLAVLEQAPRLLGEEAPAQGGEASEPAESAG